MEMQQQSGEDFEKPNEKRDVELSAGNSSDSTDDEDEEIAEMLLHSLRSHLCQSTRACQEVVPSLDVTWLPDAKLPTNLQVKCGKEMKAVSPLHSVDRHLVDGLFVPPRDSRKLNKLARRERKDTSGDKWFNMPAQTITPELKRDLQLLKLRGVLDPKHHYKKTEESKHMPKYFQIGTVIEGPADFYSGRLTRKERKTTFADELLSDEALNKFRKRKFAEIQKQKSAGRKKFVKGKQKSRG